MTLKLLTRCIPKRTMAEAPSINLVTGLSQLLSSMYLLDTQVDHYDYCYKPAYIRPLGRAVPLSANILSKNMLLADELLKETPFQSVNAVLSSDSCTLLIVSHTLISQDEQQLLQCAVQQGRLQLCLTPPRGEDASYFRLGATIFHDLDTLWPFDIDLDTQNLQHARILNFLMCAGIWSIQFHIGTQQMDGRLVAGFEQMYLPPLHLPHLIRDVP